MFYLKGKGNILHVRFHIRVGFALAKDHAAAVFDRLAHLSGLLLPVEHHRHPARAADLAVERHFHAGKVRRKVLPDEHIFQMNLRFCEQLHRAEQTAHPPEILIFQPAAGAETVNLNRHLIFAGLDGFRHIKFCRGKGILGIADIDPVAPDSGGTVSPVQAQIAVCPLFRQGEAALVFPDGVIFLRDLPGVQFFVAVPGVLGVDIMGRAVGPARLLQALHLDNPRHGQGIPV